MPSMSTRPDVAVAFLPGRHARDPAPAAWAQKTCPTYRFAPRGRNRLADPGRRGAREAKSRQADDDGEEPIQLDDLTIGEPPDDRAELLRGQA